MDDTMLDAKENMDVDQDMNDDELAGLPVTKRPRVTPRNSMAAQEANPTPHANVGYTFFLPRDEFRIF